MLSLVLGHSPFIPLPLLTHLVYLFVFPGAWGSGRLPGQTSASRKGLCTSPARLGLQSHPLMPLSANFRALGAGGTVHSSLHANYAHLTPERREGKGMSVGCFCKIFASETLPPRSSNSSPWADISEIVEWVKLEKVWGGKKKRRRRKKEKSYYLIQRWRLLKQIRCDSGVCICAYAPMHLHRIQLSPK